MVARALPLNQIQSTRKHQGVHIASTSTMQSPVPIMCLALLMSISFARTVAANPVAKVLEMMSGLQAKIIAEAEGATKMYDEAAEWCEDRSKELGFEIKTAQGEAEQLQAEIVELD